MGIRNRWRNEWLEDARRILAALHPNVTDRYRRIGPSWMLGRSHFVRKARDMGFEVTYCAYMLNRMEEKGEVV